MITKFRRFLSKRLRYIVGVVGVWLMFVPQEIELTLDAISQIDGTAANFLLPILWSEGFNFFVFGFRIIGIFVITAAIYFSWNDRLPKETSDDRIFGFYWRLRARDFCKRGNAYFTRGDFTSAIREYTQSIQFDPTNWHYYYNRGLARISEPDIDNAIEDVTDAIRLLPRYANAYAARGDAWYLKGDFDRGIADYTQVLELNPKNGTCYLRRGHSWFMKRDFGKAIEDYSAAIRFNPKDYDAYVHRAVCRQRRGEVDDALQDCLLAIQIDPQRDVAYNLIAWYRATCPSDGHRNGQEAIEYATKACDRSAWKDCSSIGTLAAAYAEIGDFTNAIKWAEKAIELSSGDELTELTEQLVLFQANRPFRDKSMSSTGQHNLKGHYQKTDSTFA